MLFFSLPVIEYLNITTQTENTYSTYRIYR